MSRKRTYLSLFLLLIILIGGIVSAQEVTEEPTEPTEPTEEPTTPPPAPLTLSGAEPNTVTAGEGGSLSIFGSNFTASTIVRLIGYGILESRLVSSGVIVATLPANLMQGGYGIEVSDPVHGTATLSNVLTVHAPAVITTEPPIVEPTNTPLPPSPVPGQPSLLARNFSTNPDEVIPGGTVTLTFEVVNQGNRTAQGVFVSVDAGATFVPANGQASATLPDIAPGGVYTVSLTVVAAMDTPAGPNSVPITMSYRDFEGRDLNSTTTLSVMVLDYAEASQVTLSRYQVNPNPVIPGQPVTVDVLVMNSGNETATQALLRVSTAEGILLAGPQGDSFPLGDIPAGGSAGLQLPLIVGPEAEKGPRSQPITITFLQNGEAQEVSGSMTIEVAEVSTPKPLLLLENYEVNREIVQPGDQFSMTLTLLNVGSGNANDLLVTFGTVEQSVSSGSGSDSTGGSGSSTTPSSTFAPLGTGGSIFVGDLDANGGTHTLTQDFIVNGTVSSGIYSLPVTLRYQDPESTDTSQTTLNASVIVIVPPQLQLNLQSPIPETANVGEPFPIALEIINVGKNQVNFRSAAVEGENVEVIEGAEALLVPLKTDEDATINALVMPSEEGAVIVTLTLHYTDDLNRPRTIVETYLSEAVTPPPMEEEFGPPIDFMPTPEPTPEVDPVGQLLLGLLGLGS